MTSSTPPPPPQCSSSDTSSSTCPVCREVFTEPKLLPCAHVVCRGCLLTRLTGESPPENTCPLCHATVLSPRDLHDFRDKPEVALDRVLLDDYGTMAVLWSQDVLRRPVGEDGGRCAGVCGLCQKEEPSSFCPDCRGGGLLLCQDCVPLHARFPDARQHVHVAALGEFTVERLAASGQVTCRRHPDWPVVRYCPAHREVLCALCEAEHATTAAGCCGAEREEVGGAAERERGRLRDLGSRLLDAGSVLNNKINHLEQDLHQGQQNFTAASLTIKWQMDQLSQALDSRRQELLHMVHKEQQRFLAAATSELASLIELNQVVVTHGQAADRLATTTPGPHLLTMMTRLLPRLAHLENRCAEETSPLPSPTPPSPSSPPTPTGSWPIEGEHQGSESETKSAHDAAELEGACGDDNGQRQQPSWAEAGTPQPAPDADTPTSVPHELSATPPPEPVPHERSATPRGVEASPQATLEVRCWAADLVLDGQTVEEVQNAIARIDFHPGVCTEDCEATIAACCFPRSHTELDAPGAEAEDTLGVSVHDKHKGKPNYVDDTIIDQTSPPAAHETRDGKELSENCASAEHGTDTAQGRQSSAQQTVTPPPPAEDGFREPGQEDYVHVLSSSASSEVRSPEHLAPLPADDGLSSGHHVVTAESVAREFGPRRQSALSRFLPSLITRYLDKADKSSKSRSKQRDSTPDLSEKDESYGDNSTPVNDYVSTASASGQGDNSDDRNRLPGRPQTLDLASSPRENSGGRGAEGGLRGLGWQMSYDAVRDKWADGSLEAADDRRQRSKSSSDAASVSAVPFLGCNEELEGSALVNTGFEVLSSPLSEACLFVDTGSRVMRGRDWSVFNSNVDGGAGKVGKVLKRGRGTGSHISGKGWVLVHWPSTGYRRWHRMGAEDCFDLLPC